MTERKKNAFRRKKFLGKKLDTRKPKFANIFSYISFYNFLILNLCKVGQITRITCQSAQI